MESTYINTGHPDFISGHKAMAIVSERMTANKPPPGPAVDPKTGKLAPGTLNNGRDLDSDLKQKEEGFFGSFWPGGRKNAQMNQKKGAAAMEPVSLFPVTSESSPQLTFLSGRSPRRTFAHRELCRNVRLWKPRSSNC